MLSSSRFIRQSLELHLFFARIMIDITEHKKILIGIGHVCQNLYLASESIGAGTCAIEIYDQKMIDNLLRLDVNEEFIIYLAAALKKARIIKFKPMS